MNRIAVFVLSLAICASQAWAQGVPPYPPGTGNNVDGNGTPPVSTVECTTGFCKPGPFTDNCADCLAEWDCMFPNQAASCEEVMVQNGPATNRFCRCECKDIPVIREPGVVHENQHAE